MSTNPPTSALVLGVVITLSVLALGAYVFFSRGENVPGGENSSSFREFVNPIVDLVKNKSLSIGARISLQDELEAYVKESIATGAITDYGIYYRELISGPVIALHQRQGFFPASLLKIPVAMWYYHQAETNPDILTEEVEFIGPSGISIEHFPPARTITPGTIYTIEELIEYMLVESDNDATHILTEYAGGRDRINEVYVDVGIRDVGSYSSYIIDTQTYSAFFRVLYNAEYLTKEYSGRVLALLATSSFKAGIARELPPDVQVAHKFGERPIEEADASVQLHDCGIVYAPENPYLLCVMTQGNDYDEMADFIAEVSARIYESATHTEE